MMRKIQYKGFTLIELSVVLVITGIIVAGITEAKAVLHQAKVKSVITDIREYTAAIKTFKLRYGYLPGDHPDPIKYWPTAAQPGNGDNVISFPGETYAVWQQLDFAEMIPGEYVGIGLGFANLGAELGINIPESRIEGVGYLPLYMTELWPAGLMIYNKYGHVIQIGRIDNLIFNVPIRGALTSIDASNMDRKLDDGNPTLGIVQSDNGTQSSADCVNQTSKKYNRDKDGQNCLMTYFF